MNKQFLRLILFLLTLTLILSPFKAEAKENIAESKSNPCISQSKEHIVIAGKIVDAAKKGKQSDVKKYNAEWSQKR